MGLKTFTVEFKNLAKEKTARCDVDFIDFQNDFLVDKYYSFNDLFQFSKENKVDIKNLEDNFLYSEIGNVSKEGEVEPVKLNFNERKVEEENYYKKIEKGDVIQTRENDILLSKVRPNLKKYVFINKENKKYFYTSAFIHLVPKKLNKILYYAFRSVFYDNLIAISRQGKSYPTLKEDDFLYLKFDKSIIDKFLNNQDQIIIQIKTIEKKIKKLKTQVKDPQEIINKVFAREFGFDLEKFDKLKKVKFFEADFENLNTPLVRSTVIQNKLSSNFLKLFLAKNSIFLKDAISKPIKRGKQPNYTEDGIKVIKTLNIQKGKIVFDEVQFVSDNFLKDNEDKAGIYQNDILLTSTGMGRGKFALYKDKEACFADSHVSIIRINNKIFLALFMNYYCQSFFGIEQLKYIEMNIKGTPEIYEAQLNYFQIPNISLSHQQKIVDEIRVELDKQEVHKKKIEAERKRIDGIIKNTIT
jgi:type I restriction enzyme, S subunit